jgi:hypothetical protein
MARWAGLLLLAIAPAFAEAQQPPQFRTAQGAAPIRDQTALGSSSAGFTGTEGLTTMPANAFQPDPPLVNPASLFRNTTYPYGPLITPPALGPSVHSESLTADFKLGLPSISGGVPFLQRGFEPQDADLKVGPFFFKLRALEAAILHSDNIYLTPDHRESGTIAIAALTVDVVAQLTETLRLATSGTFVYLPFQGKVGVTGFGLTDFYDFGLTAGPLAHAQITWNTQIGGWNVVFSDDFQISEAIYSDDIRSNDVAFEGSTFNDEAVAGRYVLRPDQNDVFQDAGSRANQVNFRNDNIVVYSNTVSAEVDRLLPGTIRLSAQVYHTDLWYNQGNRGLPELREGATISLADERENLRFKPYFIYQAFRTDEFSGVQNIFRLGVTGPITNQLQLYAEAGYYVGGFGESGALWRVQLDHTAGPYTRESLIYARSFNYFHDEITEGLGYNFQQVLGPRLNGDAYVYRLRNEDFFGDNTEFTEDEWRFGLRFTYAAGPKTTVRLTGEYDISDPNHTDAWVGRLEIGYNFTNTLMLQFVYQYQQSKSQIFQENYTENLFYLSLTKYFE